MSNPYVEFLLTDTQAIKEINSLFAENLTFRFTNLAFDRIALQFDPQEKALVEQLFPAMDALFMLMETPLLNKDFVDLVFANLARLEEMFFLDEAWRSFFEKMRERFHGQTNIENLDEKIQRVRKLIFNSYIFRLIQCVYNELIKSYTGNNKIGLQRHFFAVSELLKDICKSYFSGPEASNLVVTDLGATYEAKFKQDLHAWKERLIHLLETDTQVTPADKVKLFRLALGQRRFKSILKDALIKRLTEDSAKKVECCMTMLGTLDTKNERIAFLKEIKLVVKDDLTDLIGNIAKMIRVAPEIYAGGVRGPIKPLNNPSGVFFSKEKLLPSEEKRKSAVGKLIDFFRSKEIGPGELVIKKKPAPKIKLKR